MEKKNFAKIIVNNKSSKTDIEYTYGISQKHKDEIKIGSRVIIPFGKGNKLIEGYVVDIIDSIHIDVSRVKYIQQIVHEDTALSQELIDLCRWMKEAYMCKFIDAIQCVMPTGTSLKLHKIIALHDNVDKKKIEQYGLKDEEKIVIECLLARTSVTEEFLKRYMKEQDVRRVIEKLIEKNMIVLKHRFKSDVNVVYQKVIQLSPRIDKMDVLRQINPRAKKQREVVQYLIENGSVVWSVLKTAVDVTLNTIYTLAEKNLIEIIEVEKRRDPYDDMNVIKKRPPILTEEQNHAVKTISSSMHKNTYKPFLIHGVTGSGKTEVYMELIDLVIKESKEAIVLLPEISLTTQMIGRFKERFGDIVAVLHSKLSLGERYDEWHRIKEGQVKIVIGARSAVFAPFENLGIIVIDEEHEHTYKSEYSPKYHAIDVAKFRCQRNNAILVLGSATPSVESYTKTLNQEYQRIDMLHRFNKNPLPSIEIVDMREELDEGNKSVFSKKLYEGIMDNLQKKEQTILFLNRRGHSTFISCRKCGYVVKCPHCEISLTYHSGSHNVSCHYCGFRQKPPTICPSCSSKYIKYFGAGTEKIEKLTQKYFPNANIARLDLDTTSKKGTMDKTIQNFKRGNIDILIGTQMIAKGLDFPNVTLVGVIAADTNLNLPDFRSAERTFQLITQVAGRSGRGNVFGKVIVQTYEPEHFSITSAQRHDYISFYNQEILLRKEFFYPPYASLVNIVFTGKKEEEVIQLSNDFADKLKAKIIKYKLNIKDIIYGPHPAPLSKIKEKYRWQMIIKCKPVDQNTIQGIINYIRFESREKDDYKNIHMSIDINPFNML
ncbi:primosomal protein N' [Clostridiaceae bacterium 35-E11]